MEDEAMQVRPSWCTGNGGSAFHVTAPSLIFGLVIATFLGMSTCLAASVTLEWDRNPEADIAGYRLYYGYQSRAYSERVEVGNRIRFALGNLAEATGYYFAVTAFNRRGLESGYSNEVFYRTPSAPVSRPSRNRRPRARPLSFETHQDTPFAGHLQASDPDGDSLHFTITTQSRKGSAQVIDPATGAFLYTPAPGVTGRDSFRFRASDGSSLSNAAAVRVTILRETTATASSRSALPAASAERRGSTVRAASEDIAGGSSTMHEVRKEGLEPGTIRLEDLDGETLERIWSSPIDFFADDREESLTWADFPGGQSVDFVAVRGMNVLLPLRGDDLELLEIQSLILSDDRESLILILKDGGSETGRPWDRMALCERFPGEEWYIAVLYRDWTAAGDPAP
jgi:hypothetical protein